MKGDEERDVMKECFHSWKNKKDQIQRERYEIYAFSNNSVEALLFLNYPLTRIEISHFRSIFCKTVLWNDSLFSFGERLCAYEIAIHFKNTIYNYYKQHRRVQRLFYLKIVYLNYKYVTQKYFNLIANFKKVKKRENLIN